MRKGVVHLSNGINHMYDATHPFRPVVVNVANTFVDSSGQCLLLNLKLLTKCLLVIHLKEIVMLSKKNEKRGMFQLNIGFTGTQALQWEVQNEATRSYTGFIPEMRKLSSSLCDKLGRAMVFLCDTVVQSVLVGTPLADLFVPNVVRGKMFTKCFMEMMNLVYEAYKSCFLEGLTFFIVGVGDSMVDPHYDKNDDKRQGFDHHVTGFIGLNFTEDKGMRRQLEEVDLPAKLDIMYVAWTRKIIGEVVDKINRVPVATEGVTGDLRSILSSNSEDL
jgi:hypothetical protein